MLENGAHGCRRHYSLAGHERGKAPEKIEGLVAEGEARAPRRREAPSNTRCEVPSLHSRFSSTTTVVAEREAVLRNGGTQKVASEPFEASAIVCTEGHARVQVEAIEVTGTRWPRLDRSSPPGQLT